MGSAATLEEGAGEVLGAAADAVFAGASVAAGSGVVATPCTGGTSSVVGSGAGRSLGSLVAREVVTSQAVSMTKPIAAVWDRRMDRPYLGPSLHASLPG
jgi:hypothetical protein